MSMAEPVHSSYGLVFLCESFQLLHKEVSRHVCVTFGIWCRRVICKLGIQLQLQATRRRMTATLAIAPPTRLTRQSQA